MTTLDHRSPVTLVRDLHLHQDGLFRFEWPNAATFDRNPSNTLYPWRFVSAAIENQYRFRLCTEHPSSPGAIVYDCSLSHFDLHLPGMAGLWVVVSLPRSECDLSPDADALLRRRMDKNLRGVFS